MGTDFVDVLADHDRLLRNAFRAHEGITVNTEGDAFLVAFRTASAAIAGALAAQQALAAHRWPPEVELRVRMGLHTGEAAPSADHGYVGVAVHQAARIVAAGHGGQILASEATMSLAKTMPADASFVDLGDYRLKDFDKPQRLFELRHWSLAADLPALRVSPAVASLPKAVDSFVGRDAESIELVRLLAQHRLVTVVGAGELERPVSPSRLPPQWLTGSRARCGWRSLRPSLRLSWRHRWWLGLWGCASVRVSTPSEPWSTS